MTAEAPASKRIAKKVDLLICSKKSQFRKNYSRLARANDMLPAVTTDPEQTDKARILHVDDDPEVRLLMSGSLQEFGYVVATAGTVAEALQLAKDFKFDLFILDIRLPDGTGIELCQQLRELQPGVPIVYYSGYAEPVEQREALARCGDAFLSKPSSAAELEQTISKLLHRAKEG